MRSDIRPGATFPDYELPDHAQRMRKLSELQGEWNMMILTLNRGVYCPKDRQQLGALVQFMAQCGIGYTRIVTITTDDWLLSNDLRLGVGAHWPFLHDPERIVQQDLDIPEYTDPKNNPMVPHTFVLEPNLKIFKIYNGYWYWGRPSTAELHADLRDITSRIRFDYDLSDPEVRAAWERGERERFYPYQTPFTEALSEMGVSAKLEI
jgi:peroxiredoxin